MSINVYDSFFHNCQNLEANTIPFKTGMTKQTVTHPLSGILFNDKKK